MRNAFLIMLLLLGASSNLFATHFYGVDLFYTYVSGDTYKVTMVAYGDCSGAQFPSFSNSRPLIHIKKDSLEITSGYLDWEPPQNGTEVTPVCPAELNNTTCVNPTGTVPGVKKFVYSRNFTLTGTSDKWKFVFLGETDGPIIAGRSIALTNVTSAGIIELVATLDNTKYNNSSPVYTTIATPFYCVNRATNFNPGAVDADGDSLVYELVPGLDAQQQLIYAAGFSGKNPLDVVPGKFIFNSTNGQLNFTPATIQRSLVVYKVSEYRKGALIGSSMREMTVVVMNCDNNAPAGYITNAEGATIKDSVTVRTCASDHNVSFDINPKDADSGNTITMVANGLPKDSRLDITANNTTAPKSRFSWDMHSIPAGDYTFFVTYTDNGCPIASRQTQAYTISVISTDLYLDVIPAGCLNQGYLQVSTPEGWQPWSYKLYSEMAEVYSAANIKNSTTGDSLAPGQYKVTATNSLGCIADGDAIVTTNCNIADLPNAFSPNGDGNNDVLYVMGKGIRDIHLRIYNRWGQMVFESNDLKTGWDGKFAGNTAPVEAYAYLLSVVFENGETIDKKGNVTLLR